MEEIAEDHTNNASLIATFSNTTTIGKLQINYTETFDILSSYEELDRIIQLVVIPFIVIFGTTGNLLTFIVMRRGSLRKASTCFYMAVLALADTVLLCTGPTAKWIRELTRGTVDPDVWTDCKLRNFIFYFSSHYSSALLAIMSIEKFFALYSPLQAKSICTVKTAKWVTGIFALILFFFNSQLFFTIKLVYDEDGLPDCAEILDGFWDTFNRVDSILYSFAPLTVMILANSAIIYKFMKAKFCNQNANTCTESTNQALSKSALKGTAMVITVSVTFILLTGPSAIVYSLDFDVHEMIYTVTNILQYLNHGINGVLYCAVGSRFRNELKNIICCSSLRSRSRYESHTAGSNSNVTNVSAITSSV